LNPLHAVRITQAGLKVRVTFRLSAERRARRCFVSTGQSRRSRNAGQTVPGGNRPRLSYTAQGTTSTPPIAARACQGALVDNWNLLGWLGQLQRQGREGGIRHPRFPARPATLFKHLSDQPLDPGRRSELGSSKLHPRPSPRQAEKLGTQEAYRSGQCHGAFQAQRRPSAQFEYRQPCWKDATTARLASTIKQAFGAPRQSKLTVKYSF